MTDQTKTTRQPSMTPFEKEVQERIEANGGDAAFQAAARQFMLASIESKYSYNFAWLGRPIIQNPQDMVAMHEVIWTVKPDLIVETGIAHGGSLIFYASMLELNAACGGPAGAKVLGIDIDIRAHNRAAIEAHPMFRRIELIQGSSIAPEVIARVHERAKHHSRILVCLDSNHTHEHVLAELHAYAPLVTLDSYCVVFDTMVEDIPGDNVPGRPWGKGNNPKTAVREFLRELKRKSQNAADGTPLRFEIDKAIDHKILISYAPDGYLRRVRQDRNAKS